MFHRQGEILQRRDNIFHRKGNTFQRKKHISEKKEDIFFISEKNTPTNEGRGEVGGVGR